MENRIQTIKNWYVNGSVPQDVAVYNQSIISGIQSKLVILLKKVGLKSFDLLQKIMDDGYESVELAQNYYYIGPGCEEQYNYQDDIADQSNYFEYYKLNELVSYWRDNENFGTDLPMSIQKDILKMYRQVYMPLLMQLTDDEKKFFQDIIKLSGGVSSAYGADYDSSLKFDHLTRTIHEDKPLLE